MDQISPFLEEIGMLWIEEDSAFAPLAPSCDGRYDCMDGG